MSTPPPPVTPLVSISSGVNGVTVVDLHKQLAQMVAQLWRDWEAVAQLAPVGRRRRAPPGGGGVTGDRAFTPPFTPPFTPDITPGHAQLRQLGQVIRRTTHELRPDGPAGSITKESTA